jgi:Mg/Co/Ni transporter MgtE
MVRLAGLVCCVALASSATGCATGVGVWKREQTTMPLLVGAVVADIAVTSLIASQIQDFTVGATIGTTLAVTAVDVTIGCFLGACAPLRL